MRIELNKFGEILMSRPAGKEAYLAMKAYILKDVPLEEEIVIDFSGVKVLAPSWADEVLTKVARDYKKVKLQNTDNSSVKATLETLRLYSNFKL